MKKFSRLFVAHPETIGETYFQHLRHASSFSFSMISGGVACLLHGLFPFLFERTGSDKIRALHDRMITNRIAGAKAEWPAQDHHSNQV